MKTNKPKTELQILRGKWKEVIEGKKSDEIRAILKKYIGKSYRYTLKDKIFRVKVLRVIDKGLWVVNAKTGNEKYLPPWHLFYSVEIPNREIVGSRPGKKEVEALSGRAYVTIYQNYRNCFNEINNSSMFTAEAVIKTKQKLTADLCPWYEDSAGWVIWVNALNDLARKLNDTFVPVTESENKELW